MEKHLTETLKQVADFYDARKVGHTGPLGFRRSTDLENLCLCAERLLEEGIIRPGKTRFLDLGCADGRVNVFFSYLSAASVGVELDEWTLEEYGPLRAELETHLRNRNLPAPPDNVRLFHGDSTDDEVHRGIYRDTGIPLGDFDVFYTYLIMHEEFGRMISRKAKQGAVFMVYGLEKILPSLPGLRLLGRLSPMQGILALYRKT